MCVLFEKEKKYTTKQRWNNWFTKIRIAMKKEKQKTHGYKQPI